MSRMNRRAYGAISAAFALTLCTALAWAADATLREDLAEKFKQAVSLYNQGDYDRAASVLDDVLKMSPTSQEAWLLRERVGLGQLVKMLRQHQTADSVRKLIGLAAERDAHQRRDPAALKKLVEDLGSDVPLTRWQAMRELIAAGPFAVPYLLGPAVSDEPYSPSSRKVGAILTLRNIGTAAVPPMVAALWHADDPTANFIADFIKDNPDIRSLPALLAIAEDTSRTTSLRQIAAQVADKIAGVGAPQEKGKEAPKRISAAEACRRLAELYYYSDPQVVETIPPEDRVIWKWNADGASLPERLIFQEVAPYAYPRLIAHALAVEGIRRTPDSAGLLEIYVSNNYMFLDEAIEKQDAVASELEGVLLLNQSAGAPAIAAALERAVNDRNIPLARRCVEALRGIGDARPPEVGKSLVRALAFPDPVARFSAAETLMRLSPEGTLGGAAEAVDVMLVGLGDRLRPAAAVVTSNAELFQRVMQGLSQASIMSARYDNLADALREAKTRLRGVDLLILDVQKDARGAPATVKGVRADARAKGFEIVLIAADSDVADLQKRCPVVRSILRASASPDEIQSAVSSLTAKAEGEAMAYDVRKQSDIVQRALVTLGSLPPKTAYPVTRLAEAVAGLTGGFPEEIRLLALDALKRIGQASQRDGVFEIFASPSESDRVRQKAGETLGVLLQISPSLSADQRAVLRRLCADKDPIVASHAVRCLAIAAVPPAERSDHLRESDRRIAPLQ